MASIPHFRLLKYVCPKCKTVNYIKESDTQKKNRCVGCKRNIIVNNKSKVLSCR